MGDELAAQIRCDCHKQVVSLLVQLLQNAASARRVWRCVVRKTLQPLSLNEAGDNRVLNQPVNFKAVESGSIRLYYISDRVPILCP